MSNIISKQTRTLTSMPIKHISSRQIVSQSQQFQNSIEKSWKEANILLCILIIVAIVLSDSLCDCLVCASSEYKAMRTVNGMFN
jgi:hypothetical protein